MTYQGKKGAKSGVSGAMVKLVGTTEIKNGHRTMTKMAGVLTKHGLESGSVGVVQCFTRKGTLLLDRAGSAAA